MFVLGSSPTGSTKNIQLKNTTIMNYFARLILRFKNSLHEMKERNAMTMSEDFCQCGDCNGKLCIKIGNAPLWFITSEPTDCVKGIININDVAEFVSRVRKSYVDNVCDLS